MSPFDPARLTVAALAVAGGFSPSAECEAGSVAAAVLCESGDVFTGICIDTRCSLGFCAEHAAVAEMLKHRQTRIVGLVAVRADGSVLAPCGRCRELVRQIDPANWNARVALPDGSVVRLADLLPHSEPAGPAVHPS